MIDERLIKRGALAGAVAIGAVLAIDNQEVFSHLFSGDSYEMSGTQPFNASTKAAPYCEMPAKYAVDESLFKKVGTPDVSLFSAEGSLAVKAARGWFVVNEGTVVDPQYRLYRLSGAVLRQGPVVPDLSLLGPNSIPEVSKTELARSSARGYKLIPNGITNKDMDSFYKIPDWTADYSKQSYAERFDKRLKGMGPQYAGMVETSGPRFRVDADGLSDGEVMGVRNVVFDYVDREAFPESKTAQGYTCRRFYHADTAVGTDPDHRQALVMNEYPSLRELSAAQRSWINAHEVGHAIDALAGIHDAINDAPYEVRQAYLAELKELNRALREAGIPLSGRSTGTEGVADAVAAYLKNPEIVKEHAPRTAALIKKLVAAHPQLSKLISFS